MIADKEMLNLIEDPYNLLSELFIEKSGDGYMKVVVMISNKGSNDDFK